MRPSPLTTTALSLKTLIRDYDGKSLSSLVKNIVANTKETKGTTEHGDWSPGLLTILYDEMLELSKSSFNAKTELIQLLMRVADTSVSFVYFYTNFLFSMKIGEFPSTFQPLLDYDSCKGNVALTTTALLYLSTFKGIKSTEVKNLFKKLNVSLSESTTKMQQSLQIIMLSASILEQMDDSRLLNYNVISTILGNYLKIDRKQVISYMRSFFVWKLTAENSNKDATASQFMSSKLFKLFIARCDSTEIEKVLISAVKQHIVVLESSGSANNSKKVSSVEDALLVLKEILSPLVAVRVLSEGAAFICVKPQNRIAALKIIASYLNDEAQTRRILDELYDVGYGEESKDSGDNDFANEGKEEGRQKCCHEDITVVAKEVWPSLLDALMLDTCESVRLKVLLLIGGLPPSVITKDAYRVILRKVNDTSPKVRSVALDVLSSYLGVDWAVENLDGDEITITARHLWLNLQQQASSTSTSSLPSSTEDASRLDLYQKFVADLTRQCLIKHGYLELPSSGSLDGNVHDNEDDEECLKARNESEDYHMGGESKEEIGGTLEWKSALEDNEVAISAVLDGIQITDFNSRTATLIVQALQIGCAAPKDT